MHIFIAKYPLVCNPILLYTNYFSVFNKYFKNSKLYVFLKKSSDYSKSATVANRLQFVNGYCGKSYTIGNQSTVAKQIVYRCLQMFTVVANVLFANVYCCSKCSVCKSLLLVNVYCRLYKCFLWEIVTVVCTNGLLWEIVTVVCSSVLLFVQMVYCSKSSIASERSSNSLSAARFGTRFSRLSMSYRILTALMMLTTSTRVRTSSLL